MSKGSSRRSFSRRDGDRSGRKSALVLLDGPYCLVSTAHSGLKLDVGAFTRALEERFDMLDLRCFFKRAYGSQNGLMKALRSRGFKVIFSANGGEDVDPLIKSAIRDLNGHTHVVMITGDGDFIPALASARRARIEVFAFSHTLNRGYAEFAAIHDLRHFTFRPRRR